MSYLNQNYFFRKLLNRVPKLFLFLITTLSLLVVIASGSVVLAQTTIYVDTNVADGDGSSWDDAYDSLQDALDIAISGDQIWVAEGTYYPDEGIRQTDNDQDASFQLITGVEIYGGFKGDENNLSDRDWQINETILSGDIDGDNTKNNNSIHVVNGTGVDNTAVLDGFTITGGNALGDNPHNRGGGIFINNATDSGSPTFSHLRIIENEAGNIGGGIFSYNSSFTLFNVEINENRASYGGGIYITVGHPKLLNVGIYNNSADNDGGGINNTDEITLTNVSVNNNLADGNGGGLHNTGETYIQNSIMWGNTGDDGDQVYTDTFYGSVPTYANSLVEDHDLTDTGINNLDGTIYTTELIFTDFSGGDYSLGTDSYAINAGSNQAYIDAGGNLSNDNDLANNPRLDADIVDIGAFEFQGASAPPTPDGGVIYVNKNVSGGDGSGDSWSNAIVELADALKWAYQQHHTGNLWSESNPLEIWVAEGTYYPDEGDRSTNNDRNETFQLSSGVKVYGGFEGNESDLADRDWEEHVTVLSGDIDGNDTSTSVGVVSNPDDISGDNSYSVVTGSGADSTAILDGFTITAGSADDKNADVDTPEKNGGGVYNYEGSPTLTNLIITGNISEYRGGGVYNYNSSPVLTNVTIKGNHTIIGSSTDHHGGGIANISGSSIILINSKVTKNRAQAGGGIYNDESSPTIINTLIDNNTAVSSGGGGIYSFYGISTKLINVTVSGNHSGYQGGGIFNAYNTLNLGNTIVWGNTADDNDESTTDGNEITTHFGAVNLQHSLYGNNPEDIIGESFFFPTLTLNDDPQFMDALNGNYTLKAFSPALDSGNDALAMDHENNPLTIDQNGDLRIVRTVDMGAYEFQGEPFTVPEQVVLNSPIHEAVNVGLIVEFSWKVADRADKYQLQVSSNDEFTSIVINESNLESTTFNSDNDLNNLTTYYWRVRASNTTGEGPWSEIFNFITQDQPEASDNRILVANSKNYTFTPLDFGTTDNNYTILFDNFPSDFNGQLQLDGNDIEIDDEISINDIDEGKMIYIPLTDTYGYNFDHFKFQIKDNHGNISEESYTLHIDVGATSMELTDDSGGGWRFLTSPSIGDSYNEFLSPLTIKGIPGSDSPTASFPTLYVLNQSNYEWNAISNLTDATERGNAFIVQVQPEDADQTIILTAKNEFASLEDEFTFSGLFYDTNQGPQGNSHFLIANPHPISLDFCEFTETHLATSVDFWDPNASGGNGDYMNQSCSIDNVHIAPFQAFWVRTIDNNPSLSIPKEAYLETMTDGYYKDNKKAQSDDFLVQFTITSDDGIFTNRANILFSDQGTSAMDKLDAPKRSAAGLTERWLSFYSIGQDQKTYALQSLPLEIDDKITIPLDVQTTEYGQFILDWNLSEAQSFDGTYYLKDNQTGDVIELTEGSTYRFDIKPNQSLKKSELFKGLNIEGESQISTVSTSRFEFLIVSSDLDNFTDGDVPDTFSLAQNYPNPFNPTTIISYELPKQENVRLEVYDMAGRQVATLVNKQVSAGRHIVNFNGSNLSSGVYVYRLQAGSYIQTRKLTILK